MHCQNSLYLHFVLRDSSWSARYARGKPHPFKGVWHKWRHLNCPWVDTRPANHLGANTSLIGEYLLKPWKSEEHNRTVCQLAVSSSSIEPGLTQNMPGHARQHAPIVIVTGLNSVLPCT